MTLEILTPDQKIFSGEVYGVQLPGIDGSFEVLNRHAPLVSALKAGKLKTVSDWYPWVNSEKVRHFTGLIETELNLNELKVIEL